ncbi:hypothetical protein Tco_0740443 [Tanacetum coccineum]
MQGTKLTVQDADVGCSKNVHEEGYNANNQGTHSRKQSKRNVVAGKLGHIARECPRPKRLQDLDYFKDKMLLMQAIIMV